ncbi:MAG: radical SAM protein, partial [Deltaproteobacteria bacterium]|nr:radical SAM protein [Deltaproteobacteria bacterium]
MKPSRMHHEGILIRPPSEAHSIILQITVGCSHNKCTFCGAYKDVRFRIRSEKEIDREIDFASAHCQKQKRVFLADGDALILPQNKLEALFIKIKRRLPQIHRISLYANGRAIRSKTDQDLGRLKQLGLDRVYLGIESGDDNILSTICKAETSVSLAAASKRVIDAGLFLSTTIILGIAGIKGSMPHARQTAKLLNKIKPNQIAALTLMPLANTQLGQQIGSGLFHLPDSQAVLKDLRELIR